MHTAPSVHAELLGCVQCGGTTAQEYQKSASSEVATLYIHIVG